MPTSSLSPFIITHIFDPIQRSINSAYFRKQIFPYTWFMIFFFNGRNRIKEGMISEECKPDGRSCEGLLAMINQLIIFLKSVEYPEYSDLITSDLKHSALKNITRRYNGKWHKKSRRNKEKKSKPWNGTTILIQLLPSADTKSKHTQNCRHIEIKSYRKFCSNNKP